MVAAKVTASIATASTTMTTAGSECTNSCWGFCRRIFYGSSSRKLGKPIKRGEKSLKERTFLSATFYRSAQSVIYIRISILGGQGRRASRRKSRKRQATCTSARSVGADGFARHLGECWLQMKLLKESEYIKIKTVVHETFPIYPKGQSRRVYRR